jgi:hypothetical protein
MTGRYKWGNKTDTRKQQITAGYAEYRAALDVKRGFDLRYKKAFVNQ